MINNDNVIIFNSAETHLGDYKLVSKRSGRVRHELMLVDDPETGMIVKLVRYTAGHPVAIHKHECAKGMYVLRGILRTEQGNFGAGSFIWWKPGTTMYHGATLSEDVDVLFITNKPFDIEYSGKESDPRDDK